jgi:hypothetical protein
MNNLTKTLLSGTALGLLATVPAMAQDAPHFSVTALYADNVVNKTNIHNPRHRCGDNSCTQTISTYVPASDLDVNLQLLRTYYKFNSSGNICSNPKTSIKVTQKSKYGKTTTGTFTETSGTCVIVFYGDNYELKKAAGEGKDDSFSSSLKSKFMFNGSKYKGILYMNATVNIGE